MSKCRSCCACPGSRPRRPGSATNHPARWPCARCPSRFDAYGFAVTVGLDGPADVHDRLRPSKGGRGSFERIIERVRPLLKLRGRMQTSARVTVTPDNLDLSRTLDEFLALGFHSVGFSPMLTSPTGRGRNGPLRAPGDAGGDDRVWREIRTKDYDRVAICLLERSDRLARTPPWQRAPVSMWCGRRLSRVSSDGELAACHRFVGNAVGGMGSLDAGIDHARKTAWLQDRHVHRQSPCAGCWARYLCGGGCYHEVTARGRPACEFIRGWLHFVLQLYLRLTSAGNRLPLRADVGMGH